MVVSSTTALLTTSLPVSTELYLLFSSPPWTALGSILLYTSPKAQQLPLQMSNSTILEFPIFMAIFKGDTSELGGLGEHFMVLSTYLSILTSVEQTAEWIMLTWLKIELTLIFISFSVKQSISSKLPYLTAYMKGFQLLGVVNQLIRCGKVLKKEITCLVSPCSEYHQGVPIQQKSLLVQGCFVTWLQSVTSSSMSQPYSNLRSSSLPSASGNI